MVRLGTQRKEFEMFGIRTGTRSLSKVRSDARLQATSKTAITKDLFRAKDM